VFLAEPHRKAQQPSVWLGIEGFRSRQKHLENSRRT
jgi:hypothetical protein